MLNSPLSRSSQSSPSWHYAEPSPSPRIPHLSRRHQSTNSKSQSSCPQPTSYVDVGTQWSPRTDTHPSNSEVKAEGAPAERIAKTKLPAMPTMATLPTVNGPRPISRPALQSPATKRRQSRDATEEGPSNIDIKQETGPKRARSASRPVKLLPIQYEFCEVEDMVVLIANMISELIQTNDALPLRSVVLTRFHSRTPPGISVMDYLSRLAKHATLTPPLLLSMVYYIDRLCSLYPAFTINTLTIHRFLITAATVAAKGLSDSFWNNATYARVGGVKLAELGLLELDFLYRVDWKIVPNPEVLVDYYRGLVERSEGYELESDGLSDEDDEDNEMDGGSPAQDPEDRTDVATDTKWKAWMADVSIQSAENGETEGPKEGIAPKTGDVPQQKEEAS